MRRTIALSFLAAGIWEGMANEVVSTNVTDASVSGGKANEIIDPNAKTRHSFNTRPLELNVDAISTYSDKFMNLMESPCRPEPDGFFGATNGEPVKITYGFEVETPPLSSIVEILDIIEDKFVDNILSSSFPQICGFRRRLSAHAASGFRFFKFQDVGRSTMAILLILGSYLRLTFLPWSSRNLQKNASLKQVQ